MASTSRELLENEKIGQVDASQGILELELIEYTDEEGIAPKRLEVFISCVTRLHADVAIILGIQTGDKFTFKYFDF